MKREQLEIIIPIYNEEMCLPELFRRLFLLREQMDDLVDTEFIFVDDGSRDMSLALLCKAAMENKFIKVISFRRNFGHQMAITAGMDASTADWVAILDADLQDPPELLYDMLKLAKGDSLGKGGKLDRNGGGGVEFMKEKIQVVYGKRVKRNGETKFKLLTAHVFYRLLNSICDVTIPSDTGDFRLMRKDVIDTLRKLPERHRFVRGLVPWLGFTSVPFEYHRPERYAGSTKYPFTKMFQLAMTAILSFSVLPLRAVSIIGGISLGLSIVLGIVFLAMKLFTNQFLPGYASTILIVLFMGSVQILLTGVMAEYMAKIFEEIKGRPLYVLKTCLNFSKDSTLVNSLPYRRGDDEYDKTEDNNFNSDITVFPLSPKDVA